MRCTTGASPGKPRFPAEEELEARQKSPNLFFEALYATDLHLSILYYINISSEP